MIWGNTKLKEWAINGGIEPYDEKLINPASIDLRWSGIFIDDDGTSKTRNVLLIQPGEFILADTVEYIVMPTDAAGLLQLKSSMARQGIEHLHAGWFDPGFYGTATLELYNCTTHPVAIERGQRIVQLILMQVLDEVTIEYDKVGRYAGQRGPTPPRPEKE